MEAGPAVPFDQSPEYESMLTDGTAGLNVGKGNISSLHGCPAVVRGDFSIRFQPALLSLEFAPKHVTGDFNLFTSGVKSLEHCPKVDGRLHLAGNMNLTSLVGCHPEIKELTIYGKKINSLEGSPTHCTEFSVSDTSITNFVGGPQVVDQFSAWRDLHNLTSYEGAPKQVNKDVMLIALPSMANFDKHFPFVGGELCIEVGENLPSRMLSILKVKGLRKISFTNNGGLLRDLTNIFNEYYGQGMPGISKCQKALMQAGFNKAAGL
jgi:hypothetical protein